MRGRRFGFRKTKGAVRGGSPFFHIVSFFNFRVAFRVAQASKTAVLTSVFENHSSILYAKNIGKLRILRIMRKIIFFTILVQVLSSAW